MIINQLKVAYTHAGVFHADEVFTTALLKYFGFNGKVVRAFTVTDVMLQEAADGTAVIYDIGRMLDASKNLFDHHQDECPTRFSGIKYAAFGLVVEALNLTADEGFNKFVEAIDGCDNGQIRNAMSTAISDFNPEWDSEESEEECFNAAVDFALGVLKRKFKRIRSKAKAVRSVESAMKTDNSYVELNVYVPWHDTVVGSDKLAVIFPSKRGGFNVQLVPVTVDSFETIGKFNDNVTVGDHGCSFIHKSGFLAACDTIENARWIASNVVYKL